MGGAICLDFAIQRRSIVAGLVLVGPYYTGYHWPGIVPYMKPVVDAMQAGQARKAQELWMGIPWARAALGNPQVAPKLRSMTERNSRPFFEQLTPNVWGPIPMEKGVATLDAPTLIVVGELDTQDNHTVADLLLGAMPAATKVVIPGSGHYVPMEQPEAFTSALTRFLRQHVHGADAPPQA